MQDFIQKKVEEFEKKWNQKEANSIADKGGVVDLYEVQSFLTTALYEAYTKGREEVVRDILNVLIKDRTDVDKIFHFEKLDDFKKGYMHGAEGTDLNHIKKIQDYASSHGIQLSTDQKSIVNKLTN